VTIPESDPLTSGGFGGSAPKGMGETTAVDPVHAAFLYKEARFADEARYADWESLWDDKALYWVPMNEGADPEKTVSYIYDNRPRIAKRVGQLKTGHRHSQTPPSKMRRMLTNLELLDTTEAVRGGSDQTVTIGANFVLYEFRYGMTIWAGRYIYKLVIAADSSIKLRAKTVHLITGDAPISNLAFLI
jgi:3-phenylpropionate/cinnamic acid dioxygenase small subunit